MQFSALSQEEQVFLRRLDDFAAAGASGQTRFTAFLTERGQQLAEGHARRVGVENVHFFGGYGPAVRRMCGFFPPERAQADYAVFPISAVTARYAAGFSPGHRDFLGALLALGITRESIGDILPGPGRCTFFLMKTIAPMVCDELVKVGRTGVSCIEGYDENTLPEPAFEQLNGTVSSPRLDSLIRLVLGVSREKSAQLIVLGLVTRNDRVASAVSEHFAPGDRISVRGCGKYIVDGIGAPTRKGRLPVSLRKYR